MDSLTDFTFQGRSLVRPAFVETGTFEGKTTAAALAAGFGRIDTIEVCETYAAAAREKFASDPRVTVHHGSSRDLLDLVLDPRLPTTIFLDGHYQGWGEGQRDAVSECPLLHELKTIAMVLWDVQPYIVIDDAHLFLRLPGPAGREFVRSRGLDPDQWPRVDEVYALLPAHGKYRMDLHDDRLYCLPPA